MTTTETKKIEAADAPTPIGARREDSPPCIPSTQRRSLWVAANR